MQTVIAVFVGLMVSAPVIAEPLVEGWVRLDAGEPVANAQVRIFDMTNLQRGAIARATTDATGYFALPLASLNGSVLPQKWTLGQNYPNPFNPSTIIPYQLPMAAQVRLEVFNVLGQRVATLVDGAQAAGVHKAVWTATDEAGRAVSAGVYIYRLTVNGTQQTGRMVLVDGQAGVGSVGGVRVEALQQVETSDAAYGLVVSGMGLATYGDADFRVTAGMGSVMIEMEAQGRAKVVQDNGILGDVDNDGEVKLLDALLVAMYLANASTGMPNGGNIALGDVNGDGVIDSMDVWLIATYADDPSAAGLPAGIGEPIGNPDPVVGSVEGDRAALMALYNATAGANWKDNYNWGTDAPLGQWYGINTDENGRVASLYLVYNGLSGSIPPELGNLTMLDELSLGDNQLSGSIPSELGNLTQLEDLDLQWNELSGSIPSELGNLTALKYLHLGPNELSGSIPPELGNLTLLYRLTLDRNQLSGSIPPELGNLTRLITLWLGGNQLSGLIPSELGNLTQLEELGLGYNQLSGCIPPELFKVRNNGLDDLGLPICNLGGTVEGDRAALMALFNAIDGPNWSNWLRSIMRGWGTDASLGEWRGVKTLDGRVIELNLYPSRLTGPIPPELGNLTLLRELSLEDNELSGSIPPELGNLTQLERLNLEDNQLSGSIPPELGNLTWLRALTLSFNDLSGSIPPELGNLTQLRGLILRDNDLSGSIPSELGNLTQLEYLDLQWNDLSGSIPPELGNITGLWLDKLFLSGNQLSGCIPPELFRWSSNDLDQLDLPTCE